MGLGSCSGQYLCSFHVSDNSSATHVSSRLHGLSDPKLEAPSEQNEQNRILQNFAQSYTDLVQLRCNSVSRHERRHSAKYPRAPFILTCCTDSPETTCSAAGSAVQTRIGIRLASLASEEPLHRRLLTLAGFLQRRGTIDARTDTTDVAKLPRSRAFPSLSRPPFC